MLQISNTSITDRLKTCSRCKQEKELSQFTKCKSSKDGLLWYCKECRYADDRKYINPIKKKDTHLRKTYGITLAEYNSILEKQNFRCASCAKNLSELKTRNIHVDHDHATGAVRGVLCHSCNMALGHVNDSIEALHGLIRYLEEHSNDALH